MASGQAASPRPATTAAARGTRRAAGQVLLAADAAWRLGPRPVLHYALHRLRLATGLARRALGAAAAPAGPFLPGPARVLPAAPALPAAHAARVLAAAAAAAAPRDWHGPFPAAAHALALDLFGPGDVRPVWERSRLAALPLLAQAARLDPAGPHRDRAEALLADWVARNPPWRGPNWACGQEAALRVLHLALALALLGADRERAALPDGLRALLALHARRIAATAAYAEAQDNNHPVSEAAGLFAAGLLLGDPALARRGAARLAAAVARLVAPCGAFAQPSPAYHRLLLDTLAVAEWLRRRHGAPAFADPFAARARAAALWLRRVMEPATGALPRIGHGDDSALADLSLCGPADARGSVARALRLFAPEQAAADGDPGCAWLGLAAGAARPAPDEAAPCWRSAGWLVLSCAGAQALLRTGHPLRFRPGHADLLHLELRDGPLALLRDGGSGAYNPPAEHAWWHAHFTGTAAHNTLTFDGEDQMPRAGRFLFARWPRTEALPAGAAYTDHRGRRHARTLAVEGRTWRIEDRVAGPFREIVVRWRLAPGDWTPAPDGVRGPLAQLSARADAPLEAALVQGWESPAYGVVGPAPVLELRARAPVSRILTVLRLP
ncbi:heparinase II/III-family protein [Caldovatus sp. SYSU G05006]|uniref:Heparinase II/III-family protein n=1 Tax=Caldovatus aquaticus TaxID=2865671 RepID=A0ABS7F4J9_9PROT|nr:heparinase II/III-family protein [Caldovatus aquaticus]MBW8270443.1 heparinase II/III-family protein [Caldovatus aquaticus]